MPIFLEGDPRFSPKGQKHRWGSMVYTSCGDGTWEVAGEVLTSEQLYARQREISARKAAAK